MTKREREIHDTHTPEILAVPCPNTYCQAKPGEMCRSGMGNPTWAHVGRKSIAELARGEG